MPFHAGNTQLRRKRTHQCKEHTHPCRVHIHPCRTYICPHRELPVSVLTWSKYRKIHTPLHMVVSGITQDTRLSPFSLFQLQCREHTVVIGTYIFTPGAFQAAYRSTCRHSYYQDIFFLFFTLDHIMYHSNKYWVSRYEFQYMATNNGWRVACVHEVHDFDGQYTTTRDTRLQENNQHILLHVCRW